MEDIPWFMACNLSHTEAQCIVAKAMEEDEDADASCKEEKFIDHIMNMFKFQADNESECSTFEENEAKKDVDIQRLWSNNPHQKVFSGEENRE